MKKLIYLTIVLFLTSILAFGQDSANTSATEETPSNNTIGLSLGAKAGTMGIGSELSFALTPRLHLRLGGSYFRYEIELEAFQSEVKGSSYLKTGSISLLADFHPARYFYLSAGVLYNMLEAGIYGIPANPITIGNIQVNPDEVGYLEVTLKPGANINPYAGIGFGRAVSKNRVVSFNIDLGAAFMDSPKADLQSTGMLTPTSSEEQKRQLNENISWIQFYPMISFQLNFKIL
jgi:hypothetical protein